MGVPLRSEDADRSRCTVVEEWTDRRPGWYRVPADRALGSRTKTNHRGIVQTLANLKLASEAADRDAAPRPGKNR